MSVEEVDKPRKVFVVHGRNEKIRKSIYSFLRANARVQLRKPPRELLDKLTHMALMYVKYLRYEYLNKEMRMSHENLYLLDFIESMWQLINDYKLLEVYYPDLKKVEKSLHGLAEDLKKEINEDKTTGEEGSETDQDPKSKL